MLEELNEVLELILKEPPSVYGYLKGSGKNSKIQGMILIYPLWQGSFVIAMAEGLPGNGFLGFHIHEGEQCTGNEKDPFMDAGMHFNPTHEEHPNHVGDLPPLLVERGRALEAFYTGRFSPEEVTGKTVIIHGMRDDFTTQPSGDSGEKIACGRLIRNDWN